MRIKKTFIRYKIYMDRSRQYSGYVTFFMQTAVFIGVLASEHLLSVLRKHALIAGLIGFVVVLAGHLIVGRFDYKLGLNAEENRRHSEMNPIFTEMMDRLKRIEEKLK